MLSRFGVGRVAADPAPVPCASVPGGWPELIYRRLHGTPEMYASAYSAAALDVTAREVSEAAAQGRESWCIFDNTAQGAATGDALGLLARL